MNKDENKLFIEACRKAGLKVHTKAGNQVAAGLIIRDGQGHKYIVDSEAQLKAVSPLESIIGLARPPKGITVRASALRKPTNGIRHREKVMHIKKRLKNQED